MARIKTRQMPLLAHGFEGSHKLLATFSTRGTMGALFSTIEDESTIGPGLFLCGPAVRHENHIFCFIYKYRQRFAVVAKAIANSLGLTLKGWRYTGPTECTSMIFHAVDMCLLKRQYDESR